MFGLGLEHAELFLLLLQVGLVGDGVGVLVGPHGDEDGGVALRVLLDVEVVLLLLLGGVVALLL